jgi:hypothetical protein
MGSTVDHPGRDYHHLYMLFQAAAIIGRTPHRHEITLQDFWEYVNATAMGLPDVANGMRYNYAKYGNTRAVMVF